MTKVIKFYANWCGPCRALTPTLEKLGSKYSDDIHIVKVNVDKHQELAAQFGVRSIPALFFFQNKKVWRSV